MLITFNRSTMQTITNRLAEVGCIFDGAIGVTYDALIRSTIDLDFIVQMDSVLGCYMAKYYYHTTHKHMSRIEDIPQADKAYFWNEAKKYTDEQDRRIKAAKVIYLIDQLCANGWRIDQVRHRASDAPGVPGMASK